MNKAIMNVRMKKWAGIIQDAAASGLTKTEYCERNGINRRQFFHWQKLLREYVIEQNPELSLPAPSVQKQIRAENNQIVSAMPVFCELNPRNEAGTDPNAAAAPADAFTAGAMIRLGEYQVYVGETASEKTLSMILSVIRHA